VLEGNRHVDNDIIANTFLICGRNDEGEMSSLTEEQIERYAESFKEPEYYTAEEVKDAIFIEVQAKNDKEEMGF